MNRHHPYGGYDGPRRGGPPGGFGPDRSHRFSDRGGPSRGRGGFRGGRGGGGGSYGGYGGGAAAYDQGPPQGDMGGYASYESGPPQEPFYQNGTYNAGMPDQQQHGPPDASNYYTQGYGNYEDGSGNFGPGQGHHGGHQHGFGRGGKRGGGFRRNDRDDKVHDSIIEERIQRERPCRTLFIRNIKYETNSEDVRRLFEEHGEIRTFFDLIANRGMVFVTYYDLRAAERARERLQGSEISGRPIDVHYSLPRDDGSRGADKEKNQQLQGTLLVTLRNSMSGQPIDDSEVRRKFQQFGDVKDVRRAGDREDQRYVEFYDTRACEEAHDRLRHQGLQDGVMEIIFASDLDDPRGQSPRRGGFDHDIAVGGGGGGGGGGGHGGTNRDWEDFGHRGRRGGRGGRGRGRGWGGNDWDRRDDWGRDRERNRPLEDEFGRDTRGSGLDDRFDNRGTSAPGYGAPPPPPPPMGGPGSIPPPGGYGGPPPSLLPPTFAQPPATVSPPDERLEQAKKVQQLLAALKQPVGAAPVAPAQNLPPNQPPMPSAPGQPPYYGALPLPMQGGYPGAVPLPPANTYSGQQMHPPASASAPPPAPAAGGVGVPNLPPNILAMLQQGQTPSQQGSPPPPNGPPNTYSMPPQATAPPPSGMSNMPPPNGQPGYQQLMAYLSQKRPQ